MILNIVSQNCITYGYFLFVQLMLKLDLKFLICLGDDIKPCPRCQVLIVKMDDGSCNHMTCAVCGAEFCWLCMKEISDLHYLRLLSYFEWNSKYNTFDKWILQICYYSAYSPSGCTFWGKKPWSRKKKILWQLGTLVGAPIGIGLVAGIAFPAMIIGWL